jgi:hypothetical protein
MRRPLVATLAFGFALALSAPAHGTGRRVLVMPLGSLGVDENEASSLLGFLRAEVAKLPGISLVEMPSKPGRFIGGDCKGEEKCLAAAGAKLNVDEVVTGTVAGVGEAYSIDLKSIQVRTGREDARITEIISGERELLIDGIRGAAYKLLVPSQYAGTIQLDLAEDGAEVFVDGRPAGKTPLKAPIPGLTPGKHALKLVKGGFADFDKWVDVRFGRVSVVKVDLRNSVITGVMFEKEGQVPKETPFIVAPSVAVEPKPIIMTGQRIGAVVLAAVGAGIAGTGGYFADRSNYERKQAASLQVNGGGVLPQNAPRAEGHLAAMRANSIAADIYFATGGAAVAAGIILWFTGAQSSQTAPAVSVGPGGASVGITGSF